MQEINEGNKKEKDAQMKREWRARKKAIDERSYIPRAIEEAKKYWRR